MKKIVLALGVLLFCCTHSLALAGSAQGAAHVQTVGGFAPGGSQTSNGSLFFFSVDGIYASNPGCAPASQTTSSWVLDLSAPAGKAQYTTVLAAKLFGLPIYVAGT